MATSFEKKLDKDFWYYLTLAKEVYENFSTDDEKNSCEVRLFPFIFSGFLWSYNFLSFRKLRFCNCRAKLFFIKMMWFS